MADTLEDQTVEALEMTDHGKELLEGLKRLGPRTTIRCRRRGTAQHPWPTLEQMDLVAIEQIDLDRWAMTITNLGLAVLQLSLIEEELKREPADSLYGHRGH